MLKLQLWSLMNMRVGLKSCRTVEGRSKLTLITPCKELSRRPNKLAHQWKRGAKHLRPPAGKLLFIARLLNSPHFCLIFRRCSSSEMAKEIETELRKSFETLVENEENHCSSNNKSKTKIPVKSFARPMFNKRARDDPKCPSEFKFESLACTEPKVAQKLLNSRLILEIAHLLFCRQWKLIAQSSVPQTAKR